MSPGAQAVVTEGLMMDQCEEEVPQSIKDSSLTKATARARAP